MAAIRIAIQGFGRLGRSVFKIARDRGDAAVVAVRGEYDAETCAYLLKHDSVYGEYARATASSDDQLVVSDSNTAVLLADAPLKDSWANHKIDVVIDTTGASKSALQKHITAGARQVVALAGGQFESLVMGVNDDLLSQAPQILGAGDGATSAIAPVLAVLDQNFTVKKSSITLVDGGSVLDHSLRTSREPAETLIPSSFAASSVLQQAAPHASLTGLAVHTPSSSVGLAVVTVLLENTVTAADVNQAFRHAAQEPLYQGIITTTTKPLVSADLRGTSYSATIDEALTAVAGGDLVQLAVWFDAEWGFANRLVELAVDAGRIARSRAS